MAKKRNCTQKLYLYVKVTHTHIKSPYCYEQLLVEYVQTCVFYIACTWVLGLALVLM